MLYCRKRILRLDKFMIENAIILAAGTGSRLKPLTNRAPKCLTEVNKTPIMANMLKNLQACGVKRCCVVTGYLSDVIKTTIGNNYHGLEVHYIHNHIFSKTNDMYSLWMARELLEEGSFIIEGDIFFRSDVLINAMERMENTSYYFAGKYNGIESEILIKTGPSRKIDSIEVLRGQTGEIGDLNFMSAGIMSVDSEYGRHFSRWLTDFVNEGRVDVLFDDVLSTHIGEKPLYVFEISHSDWVEIDTLEDLKRAETVFISNFDSHIGDTFKLY
jgi:choline kinase